MTRWRPDPTYYPSPKLAIEAPPERLAYVALLNPKHVGQPDAVGVVDVDPSSKTYGRLVGQVDLPYSGDELHHFGWNACSSCLCAYASHPHTERRYLVVPGIRSSRIHIIDTKPQKEGYSPLFLNASRVKLICGLTAPLKVTTSCVHDFPA